MGIKYCKPTSPGRRGYAGPDFAEITCSRPEKSLVVPLNRSGGRNNHGHITSRFRGGGHKRMYRIIDFRRDKDGIPGKVKSIEYDPNRSARIALVFYADGEKRYIIAPKELAVGQTIESGELVDPRAGHCMPLRHIPVGISIHNVELIPGHGAQLARSAGCYAQLLGKEGAHAVLALPSGEIRRVNLSCRATIGAVGNEEHALVKIGKAGRNRWKGWRPHNRGTSMNPVAHPMGGGEGRTSGGRHPCSPTGKLAKGGKTRNPRKASNRHIIRRRKQR